VLFYLFLKKLLFYFILLKKLLFNFDTQNHQ